MDDLTNDIETIRNLLPVDKQNIFMNIITKIEEQNTLLIQEKKELERKSLWYKKVLKEIMWKTGTDIDTYPHWSKEELILEYHLIVKGALEKFNDSYRGSDLEFCSKLSKKMLKEK